MRALMMSTTRLEISIPYVACDRSSELTGRLQAGTANEEAVNIGLGRELAAVLLADGTTVDDTDVILSLGADGLAEPLTDSGVNLLSLLGGSDLAGTNSPDGLVGNNDLRPLLLGQLLGGGVELTGNDLNGLVGLPLLYDCK